MFFTYGSNVSCLLKKDFILLGDDSLLERNKSHVKAPWYVEEETATVLDNGDDNNK